MSRDTLSLGQVLSILAAVLLVFQPILHAVHCAPGAKARALEHCLTAPSADAATVKAASKTPGGDKPDPKSDCCRDCLHCPGLVQLAALIGLLILVLTPSARARRLPPMIEALGRSAPLASLFQARAPPAIA